ncbi:MAG: hypothetical protein QNK25_10250 [Desulfobacterales bacterium]|nr:hypothetical protein [Desulfobacterales bacterium]
MVQKRLSPGRRWHDACLYRSAEVEAAPTRCKCLGAFGYLQKPVDIEKLSLMLKEAHRQVESRRSK